jgi:TolB-like protein
MISWIIRVSILKGASMKKSSQKNLAMGICVFMMLLVCVMGGYALPKVAVFDVELGEQIDRSAVIPITETIITEMSKSRDFLMLDRSNIEKTLKEQEFQLSGLVAEDNVAELGKLLGADYIIVLKAQKLGEAWFLTGKMIEVKTSIIYFQTSISGHGDVSVLISLAQSIGKGMGLLDQNRSNLDAAITLGTDYPFHMVIVRGPGAPAEFLDVVRFEQGQKVHLSKDGALDGTFSVEGNMIRISVSGIFIKKNTRHKLEMVGLVDGKTISGTFTDSFDSGVVQFGDFVVNL